MTRPKFPEVWQWQGDARWFKVMQGVWTQLDLLKHASLGGAPESASAGAGQEKDADEWECQSGGIAAAKPARQNLMVSLKFEHIIGLIKPQTLQPIDGSHFLRNSISLH